MDDLKLLMWHYTLGTNWCVKCDKRGKWQPVNFHNKMTDLYSRISVNVMVLSRCFDCND
jgi:hypothetical protein